MKIYAQLFLVHLISFMLLSLAILPTNAALAEDFSYIKLGKRYYGVYDKDIKVGFLEHDVSRSNSNIIETLSTNLQGKYVDDQETTIYKMLYKDQSVFDLNSKALNSGLSHYSVSYFNGDNSFQKGEPDRVENTEVSFEYVSNNQYKLTSVVGGFAETTFLDLPKLLLEDYYSELIFVIDEPSLGDRLNTPVQHIDFTDGKVVPLSLEVKSINQYDNNLAKYTSYDLEGTIGDGTSYHIRIGQDLEVLETSVGPLKMKLEPEAVAKAIGEVNHISSLSDVKTTASKGVLLNNLSTSIGSIVVEVSGYSLDQSLIENERQKIIEVSDDKAILWLSEGKFSETYLYDEKSDEYLSSTLRLDLNNGDLISINPKEELIGLTEEEKIRFLTEFVYNFLDYEYVAVANLTSIISDRRGDCTEYAQLLTSLARLNGIPAREVSGYIYNFSEISPNFSRHAWVEVFINGKWFEVDPGWNEFGVNASHIQILGYDVLEEVNILAIN